jgi:hypothetical protein
MRYGSCYLSERRYVKHVLVTGARAARSPGHVRFNVGQKILRRSLVCAPDADCPVPVVTAHAEVPIGRVRPGSSSDIRCARSVRLLVDELAGEFARSVGSQRW